MPPMPNIDYKQFVIGFKPTSNEEPAHFFIAQGTRAVCCTPIRGFAELDDEQLLAMAAIAWQQLTADGGSAQVFGAISIGWMDALHAQADDPPATLH